MHPDRFNENKRDWQEKEVPHRGRRLRSRISSLEVRRTRGHNKRSGFSGGGIEKIINSALLFPTNLLWFTSLRLLYKIGPVCHSETFEEHSRNLFANGAFLLKPCPRKQLFSRHRDPRLWCDKSVLPHFETCPKHHSLISCLRRSHDR